MTSNLPTGRRENRHPELQERASQLAATGELWEAVCAFRQGVQREKDRGVLRQRLDAMASP